MDLKELVHPGMTLEKTFVVGKKHLASHLGSGGASVLATPYMIAFMEGVSHSLLAPCVPEGYSSVGTHVDIRHLAPTPQGSTVRVKTEVVEVEGNLVKFNIQAWDEYEQIGSGLHERAVIEIARFQRRVTAKSKSG
jgi:fluoroacetyl-CoA thioesterase